MNSWIDAAKAEQLDPMSLNVRATTASELGQLRRTSHRFVCEVRSSSSATVAFNLNLARLYLPPS
jgi:hypothetical protein